MVVLAQKFTIQVDRCFHVDAIEIQNNALGFQSFRYCKAGAIPCVAAVKKTALVSCRTGRIEIVPDAPVVGDSDAFPCAVIEILGRFSSAGITRISGVTYLTEFPLVPRNMSARRIKNVCKTSGFPKQCAIQCIGSLHAKPCGAERSGKGRTRGVKNTHVLPP